MNTLTTLIAQFAEWCELAVEDAHAGLTGEMLQIQDEVVRCESRLAAMEMAAHAVGTTFSPVEFLGWEVVLEARHQEDLAERLAHARQIAALDRWEACVVELEADLDVLRANTPVEVPIEVLIASQQAEREAIASHMSGHSRVV